MSSFLSVKAVAFTVLGYPMSWVELTGTVLLPWSAWLIGKRSPWTWPIGIVSVLLFLAVSRQIRLDSDALEHACSLGACAYGWWRWAKSMPDGEALVAVSYSRGTSATLVLVATAALSAGLGAAVSRADEWAPRSFPEAASYP